MNIDTLFSTNIILSLNLMVDIKESSGSPSSRAKLALRIALFVICTLSLLIGLSLASIGIGILANKAKLRGMINLIDVGEMEILEKYKNDVGELIDKYDVISNTAMAFIVLGLMVCFVSALGLVGAWMASRIVLIVYAVLMSILLVSVLLVAIYCTIFKDRISNKMMERMVKLQDEYFISVIQLVRNKDTVKAMLTLAVNFMHFSLRCCGIRQVGDARNSTSWRRSERRIMQLLEVGADLFKTVDKKGGQSDHANDPGAGDSSTAVRQRRTTDYNSIFDYTSGNGNQPDWMRFDVPLDLTVPPDYIMPTILPEGFEIDEDFFEGIGKVIEDVITDTVQAITEALDEVLVMNTPLTCCQMDGIKKLLSSEFDVSTMYDSMQEISCVFETQNFGVNNVTCYDALWTYIGQFVTPVLALAGLLIFLMVATIGASLGIIFIND